MAEKEKTAKRVEKPAVAGAPEVQPAKPKAAQLDNAATEKITAQYKNDGTALVDAMRRELAAKEHTPLPKEKLLPFVENPVLDAAGNIIGGKFDAHGDSEINRRLGLRHIIPAEYTFVTVTTASGEVIHGKRREDGSFGRLDKGKSQYVPIWSGDTFVASKVADVPKKAEPQNSAPKQAAEKNEKPRTLGGWICFGDSITEGMSGNLAGAGAEVSAFKGNWISTDRSKLRRAIAQFIEEKKTGQHAEINTISILAGANDISGNAPVKKIRDELVAIFRAAREVPGLRIVACTLTPWKEHEAEISELNAEIMKLASAGVVDRVIDVHTAMQNSAAADAKNALGIGGLHPKSAGYARLAAIMKENAA